jgi:hemolysin III
MSAAFALHLDGRPRLRGVSHVAAFFVFLVTNLWLLALVTPQARPAVAIYAASHACLFGVSAMFHRRTWSPRGFDRMRALDHAAVFVLIAGSYSPLFLLLGEDPWASWLAPMTLMWTLAAMGVAKSLFWTHGPAWLTAAFAIAMGWSGAGSAAALVPAMGTPAFALLLASGVVYTLGGLVYALRRPDPLPEVFGYHEVFHACVIAGGVVHYAHTLLVLAAAGAF